VLGILLDLDGSRARGLGVFLFVDNYNIRQNQTSRIVKESQLLYRQKWRSAVEIKSGRAWLVVDAKWLLR
jgi:hypothetical protein